jgi:Icc-related predicted phosphoesterase
VGGRAAVRRGNHLRFTEADKDGQLVLGVLGPVNEDSPNNLQALQKYLTFFQAEKADAIVVDGDTGETEEGIVHVLDAVAASKVPVLVVIGNRECRADYAAATRRVSEKRSNLVNLNEVRTVEFPEATLISVPGYHDPNFINCAKGCQYFQSTLDEAAESAKAATSPVILVAHGPPLGEGSQALDYATPAGNVGDPALRAVLSETGVRFGIFAHIKEAGSRATDLAGTTVVDPDRAARVLFLNPGPANTAKWKMNDGTSGHGFAAIFALKGQEARWKPLRLAASPEKPGPDKRRTPGGRRPTP